MNEPQEMTASRWSVVTYLMAGLFAGLAAGLLEAVTRTWLQSAGLASFAMRLTTVSAPLFWTGPLLYAAAFGAMTLIVGLIDASRRRPLPPKAVLMPLGAIVFVAPLGSTDRLSRISMVLLSMGLAASVLRLLPRTVQAQARVVRLGLLALGAVVLVLAVGARVVEMSAASRAMAGRPAARSDAPNVLLVVFDTLRADHVTSYGYGRETTPTLTRLAREGVQFNWALASSSWTLPSHASLLTGLYPREHGAALEPLQPSVPTLPSALAGNGYRTGAISANTLVFSRAQGFSVGFDYFSDSFYSVADSAARTYYGGQVKKRILTPLGWADYPGRRRAKDVTAAALEWIAADESRPFFLMVNYFDMHDPYLPPAPWRSRFSAAETPGGRLNSRLGRAEGLTASDVQSEIDAYDGAIAYADHWFGELLDGLEALEQLDGTVVVATSDHGESFGEHELFGHGMSLRLEQIHVPLIMRYPAAIPADLQVEVPVSQISLANALLDLAGLPQGLPSAEPSLSALWRGASGSDWLPPLAELASMPWEPDMAACGAARSILLGRHHLIEHDRCEAELYDIAADPGERRNLAGDQSHRALLERLRSALRGRLRLEPSH